jgi:hypothetical protein
MAEVPWEIRNTCINEWAKTENMPFLPQKLTKVKISQVFQEPNFCRNRRDFIFTCGRRQECQHFVSIRMHWHPSSAFINANSYSISAVSSLSIVPSLLEGTKYDSLLHNSFEDQVKMWAFEFGIDNHWRSTKHTYATKEKSRKSFVQSLWGYWKHDFHL